MLVTSWDSKFNIVISLRHFIFPNIVFKSCLVHNIVFGSLISDFYTHIIDILYLIF